MTTVAELRAKRDRQHTGKAKYPNKRAAKKGIRQMRSLPRHERHFEENDDVGYLNPYRCPWCPFWHIGHDATTRRG